MGKQAASKSVSRLTHASEVLINAKSELAQFNRATAQLTGAAA